MAIPIAAIKGGAANRIPYARATVLTLKDSTNFQYDETTLILLGSNATGIVSFRGSAQVSDANWGHVLIGRNATTAATEAKIAFVVGDSYDNPIASIGGYLEDSAQYAGRLTFYTRENTASTSALRMFIDSGGMVTIGALTNQRSGSKLFVGSAADFTAVIDCSSATAAHWAMEIGRADVSAANFVNFIRDLTSRVQCGNIARNAGTDAVIYSTSSDSRLKVNIAPTKRGLDLLLRIPVSDYSWREDATGRMEQGLMAQALHNLYPEAVKVGGENPTQNPWGIDYGRLSPLLVKSIQDLAARVAKLERP